MLAELLNKGTKTRTAEQIAESIDFVGGSLGASAGDDWISVSSTVLTEFLDTALVPERRGAQPTFPEEELETERTRALSALQANFGSPGFIAARRHGRDLRRPPVRRLRDARSRSARSRGMISVAFHRTHFRPGNALVVVAGDVRPDDVVRRIERHFGDWSGHAGQGLAPTPPERSAREIVFVHKPGTVQAVIRFGHLMPPATHRDWIALDVATQILGGGTTGWFFQTLRQEKGYTYGAYVGTAQKIEPGYFQAGAEVRNEDAESALEEFFRLISRLRDEPVPAADLETARNYMTGSFPLTIETPQQVAGQIASTRLLGLPNDHLARYRDRVAAVTAADVQRVAREHIRPDRAVVVVVGDATQILDKVEKFGPVRIVDPDGNPLDRSALAVTGADIALDGSAIEPATLVYDVKFQGNAVAQSTTTITGEEIDGVAAVRSTTEMSAWRRHEERSPSRPRRCVRSSPRWAAGGAADGPHRVQLRATRSSADAMSERERPISIDAVSGTLLPGMARGHGHRPRHDEAVPHPGREPATRTIVPLEFKVVGSRRSRSARAVRCLRVEVSGGPCRFASWPATGRTLRSSRRSPGSRSRSS